MVRRMRSDLANYDYLLPGDYVPDPPLRKRWFRWRPAFAVTDDMLVWAGDIARARVLMDLRSVEEAIASPTLEDETMADGFYARLQQHAQAGEWAEALALMRLNDLPAMKAAFRTTQFVDGRCQIVFQFPDMETMHAADREWHEFRAASADTRPEGGDALAAPFTSGAVRDSADAQTPSARCGR